MLEPFLDEQNFWMLVICAILLVLVSVWTVFVMYKIWRNQRRYNIIRRTNDILI